MTRLRFGKTIPLPSTAEIKHELRLMMAGEALAAAASAGEIDGILRDLSARLGLSRGRADSLVERFGSGRTAPVV